MDIGDGIQAYGDPSLANVLRYSCDMTELPRHRISNKTLLVVEMFIYPGSEVARADQLMIVYMFCLRRPSLSVVLRYLLKSVIQY